MTVGAMEGARQAGVTAELRLAVDLWTPALKVIESTFGLDPGHIADLDSTGYRSRSWGKEWGKKPHVLEPIPADLDLAETA
jgi:hypothetical protein